MLGNSWWLKQVTLNWMVTRVGTTGFPVLDIQADCSQEVIGELGLGSSSFN